MSKRTRDNLVAYSFIAPNFLGFFIITLIPMVVSFVLSLFEWNGATDMKWVGLDNFSSLFAKHSKFPIALGNTLLYVLGTVPLTMICALALAMLLNKKLRGRNFFRTVAFFPYVASLVAVSVVWRNIFNPNYGPLNNTIASLLGVELSALPQWGLGAWALPSVILFTVWKNMGYYMVIFLAALQGTNPELYEAADIDGAGAWRKFRSITLPQIAPATFFVTMMLIINSFKVYDIFINIFAGPDNTLTDASRVLVYEIYNSAFKSLNYGFASAQAIILFVLVLGITLVQFSVEKRVTE